MYEVSSRNKFINVRSASLTCFWHLRILTSLGIVLVFWLLSLNMILYESLPLKNFVETAQQTFVVKSQQ